MIKKDRQRKPQNNKKGYATKGIRKIIKLKMQHNKEVNAT